MAASVAGSVALVAGAAAPAPAALAAAAAAAACAPGAAAWAEAWFGDCLYDARDRAGFALGLASIACWVFAQVPQVVRNYRRRSADALSPWFLAEWLLGDTFNLLGALLRGDQPRNIVLTAEYFICADVVLLTQWLYYKSREEALAARARAPPAPPARHRRRSGHRHHHHHRHARGEEAGGAAEAVEAAGGSPPGGGGGGGGGGPKLRALATGAGAVAAGALLVVRGPGAAAAARRRLLGASRRERWRRPAGAAFGFASCALYLFSRLAQLRRNWSRRSVEGLALGMFALAIAANALYGAAILLRARAPASLAASAPWLLGSLGTVALDAAILGQARLYGARRKRRAGSGGGGGAGSGDDEAGEEASLLPA
jgi:hypothetical protein